MEKLTKNNDLLSLLSEEYAPLAMVMGLLRQHNDLGYQTRFSFKPFVDQFKKKLATGCDYTKSAIFPVLEKYSEMIEQDEISEEEQKSDAFKALISLVVPSMIFDDNYNFVSKPFDKHFIATTEQLQALFDNEKYELKIEPQKILDEEKSRRYLHLYILHYLYGLNVLETNTDQMTLRNKETMIDRHFQMRLQFDFVEVDVKQPLPELSSEDLVMLTNNIENYELWEHYFPLDSLSFHGFVIGSLLDVTEVETISDMKEYLTSVDQEYDSQAFFNRMSGYLRSYLNIPCIEAGEFIVGERTILRQSASSLTEMSGDSFIRAYSHSRDEGGLYTEVLDKKETVFIPDLESLEKKSELEQILYDKSFRSLVLHPILNPQGQVLLVLEIAAHKPLAFNALMVKKMENFFDILESSYHRFISNINTKISAVVKEKFTAIHPSVEWKFKKSATKYFQANLVGIQEEVEPVVLENLHPLYGQADIVGSSIIRNTAIQNDLIENLELLQLVIKAFTKKKKLHILQSFEQRVADLLIDLRHEYKSSDESTVVHLLVDDIHPLLDQMVDRYPELPKAPYAKYRRALDPVYGIVYKERKSYEESVAKLNTAIANFLLAEDEKMQQTLPHYFEKYKTDGVEYNIYLGQAILQKQTFSANDLREFKIWQLVHMAELTKMLDGLRYSLSMPLQTAQLIFVYNNPISIRFRMDEKRFDVDGAYNVRYEILKKRIDKAYVKDTEERLTQSGKISIVYLLESDKVEYMEYLRYLQKSGYIDDEIEELELDRMQGVDGLKALRVSVNV